VGGREGPALGILVGSFEGARDGDAVGACVGAAVMSHEVDPSLENRPLGQSKQEVAPDAAFA